MWAATAALSLIAPGAGHALVGRLKTGLLFAGAFALAMIALGLTVWGLVAIVAVWLGAICDAIRLSRRGVTDRWWPTLVFVFVFLFMALGFRFTITEAFKIPSSSMSPTLIVGDHIFVSHLLGFERGDLIVFHTPCMPDRDYVERIVAVPGDTVEMRCEVLYINGKAVPHELADADATYDDMDEYSRRWMKKPARRFHETFEGRTYDVLHMAGDASHDRDFPRDATLPSCVTGYFELGRNVIPIPQPAGKIVVASPEPDDPCALRAHFVVPEGGLFGMGDNRDNANDSRYWGVIPMKAVVGRVTGVWNSKGPDGMRWSRFGSVH
jgi:signal peptidase I